MTQAKALYATKAKARNIPLGSTVSRLGRPEQYRLSSKIAVRKLNREHLDELECAKGYRVLVAPPGEYSYTVPLDTELQWHMTKEQMIDHLVLNVPNMSKISYYSYFGNPEPAKMDIGVLQAHARRSLESEFLDLVVLYDDAAGNDELQIPLADAAIDRLGIVNT